MDSLSLPVILLPQLGIFAMCNLYSITINQAASMALFRAMNRYTGNLPPMSPEDVRYEPSDGNECFPDRREPRNRKKLRLDYGEETLDEQKAKRVAGRYHRRAGDPMALSGQRHGRQFQRFDDGGRQPEQEQRGVGSKIFDLPSQAHMKGLHLRLTAVTAGCSEGEHPPFPSVYAHGQYERK
jgi:hypothetical protein